MAAFVVHATVLDAAFPLTLLVVSDWLSGDLAGD
jgi:hypothetical protein